MVFRQTVSASCCVWFILTQFFRELTEEENIHSYFMQNGATVYTINLSLAALEEVFSKHWILHILWPCTSPDLNLCDLKNRANVNNPYSLYKLKDGISREID